MYRIRILAFTTCAALSSCSSLPEIQPSEFDGRVITFVHSTDVQKICGEPVRWVESDCNEIKLPVGEKARIMGMVTNARNEPCIALTPLNSGGLYYYCELGDMSCAMMFPEDNLDAAPGSSKPELIGTDIWANSNMLRFDRDIIPVKDYAFEGLDKRNTNAVRLRVVSLASTLSLGLNTIRKRDNYFLVRNKRGDEALLPTDSKRFFKYDPIKTEWPPQVLDNIKNGKLSAGMPKDAVILSWGPPETIDIKGVNERWNYGNKYVYFWHNLVVRWNEVD